MALCSRAGARAVSGSHAQCGALCHAVQHPSRRHGVTVSASGVFPAGVFATGVFATGVFVTTACLQSLVGSVVCCVRQCRAHSGCQGSWCRCRSHKTWHLHRCAVAAVSRCQVAIGGSASVTISCSDRQRQSAQQALALYFVVCSKRGSFVWYCLPGVSAVLSSCTCRAVVLFELPGSSWLRCRVFVVKHRQCKLNELSKPAEMPRLCCF